LAIERTISCVTSPFTLQPRKMSAPFITSGSVRIRVSMAKRSL
jgi:hypothetical protein